ncbi:MAG: 4Fe-4S binding protein [Firmicutes bacterium]|nr:4Fe-4S binding protein [Bacillota bacterium]
MKNKQLNYVFVILTILVVIMTVSALYAPVKVVKNSSIPLDEVKKILPEAAKIVPGDSEKGWQSVLNASGGQIGSVAASSPYTDDITGYGGSTPLLIFIDNDGKIKGAVLLENQESPDFIKRVLGTGILSKWNGTPWKESVSVQVDTVSGATMSSTSLIKTFRKRISLIDPSSVQVKPQGMSFGWKDGVIIFLTLTGIALCHLKIKNTKTLRYIQLGLSVVFLGFITAACFSVSLLYAWIKNGIPLSGSIGILFLIGAAVIMPILTGKNHHCFFVCPYGAFQELIFKIIPVKANVKPQVGEQLRKIRYLLLILFSMVLLFNIQMDTSLWEPFSAFLFRTASVSTLIIAGAGLIAGAFLNRPWCSYCCPAGAFLDELKRPAPEKTVPSQTKNIKEG